MARKVSPAVLVEVTAADGKEKSYDPAGWILYVLSRILIKI